MYEDILEQLASEGQTMQKEIARLHTLVEDMATGGRVVERTIAQGLRLLQTQLVNKPSRAELEEAINKALDTSRDAYDRLQDVSDALSLVESNKADTSEMERLSEIINHFQSLQIDSPHITQSNPHHPKRCLSCSQELPILSHTYNAPHQMVGQTKAHHNALPSTIPSCSASKIFGAEAQAVQRGHIKEQFKLTEAQKDATVKLDSLVMELPPPRLQLPPFTNPPPHLNSGPSINHAGSELVDPNYQPTDLKAPVSAPLRGSHAASMTRRQQPSLSYHNGKRPTSAIVGAGSTSEPAL